MTIKTIKSKDITEEEKQMNAKALASYKGLTLVKLRDYQIRLLKLFGEEKYIKELDIIAPKT